MKEMYLSVDNEAKICQATISKSFKEWMDSNLCSSFLRDTIKKFEDINL